MQNAAPDGSGAVLLGGLNCDDPTENRPESQAVDAAQQLRTLALLQRYDIRPALANDIAALAYGEVRT